MELRPFEISVMSPWKNSEGKQCYTYSVILEHSNELVVGVYQFTVSHPSPGIPHSLIFRARGRICVCAFPMSNMVLPFTFVSVTIHVVILSKTTPLIFYPAAWWSLEIQVKFKQYCMLMVKSQLYAIFANIQVTMTSIQSLRPALPFLHIFEKEFQC